MFLGTSSGRMKRAAVEVKQTNKHPTEFKKKKVPVCGRRNPGEGWTRAAPRRLAGLGRSGCPRGRGLAVAPPPLMPKQLPASSCRAQPGPCSCSSSRTAPRRAAQLRDLLPARQTGRKGDVQKLTRPTCLKWKAHRMHGVLRVNSCVYAEGVNICSRSLSDPDAEENVARRRGSRLRAQKRASVLFLLMYV